MATRCNNIKQWVVYTDEKKYYAERQLVGDYLTDDDIEFCGFRVVAYVAFEHEVSARTYGEQIDDGPKQKKFDKKLKTVI